MSKIIELNVMREHKGQTISLLRGIRDHLRVDTDNLQSLAAGVKALTPQDKLDLASQMKMEFGYADVTFGETPGPVAA